MLSPYKITRMEIKDRSALISLTYEQLVAVANALWNLYALIEHPDHLEAVKIAAKADESIVQSVHDAMMNCTKSLDALNQAGQL